MLFAAFERLVEPYPHEEVTTPPSGFRAFVWACSHGVRRYLAAIMLLTAAVGVFEALLFAMLGRVVDWLADVQPDRLWADHGDSLLLLAAILLGSTLLVALQAMFKNQSMAGNFPMRLRWNFHRLLLRQSMHFYQHEFAGRIVTKMMQTAMSVRDVWMILSDVLVFLVIYFITMVVVIGGFDAFLLLPFLAWVALYIGALCWFVPRLGRTASEQADARSTMTGRITDAYSNIATVKLFSHAGHEANHARSAMQEFLLSVHSQTRLISGFELVNHVLGIALILATGGVTLWLWSMGDVGIGAVAAATAMSLRLNGISHWIMWEMANLFEQIGAVRDGINMLSQPQAVSDRPDAVPLRVGRGEVQFDAVSFRYGPTSRAPVINRLSLLLRPGEKVGLVGRSGAGKSTIVNLLLRFYDVESGNVLIDGQDIAGVTKDSLRAQIGMVTQDTSLLHRSVRENILYGKPDASEEDMVRAAKRAEAHDFILGLTDAAGRTGYDAHVGERGVTLSGGQRQRIAIARVMLKDAPILLLDEATSALDSEVESAIQASLYRLMEGKTVLVIAHRLSTISAMDRLVVLDNGSLVETGSHSSLLAAGGLYARLWAHQSGALLVDEDGEELFHETDATDAGASADKAIPIPPAFR